MRPPLIQAAKSVGRQKDGYLAAQYPQIARRSGPNKAAVAAAHSMVVIAWQLLGTGQCYEDFGGDYFQRRRKPATRARQLTHQLAELGYTLTNNNDGTITLTPPAAAA